MSEYGVSDTGFKRKTLDVLITEISDDIRAIPGFGENFNTNPASPDGQKIGVLAKYIADVWEVAELAYNAFNPNAINGVPLYNLVSLNGLTPNRASRSRVLLNLTGTPGTFIETTEANPILVSTSDTNVQFQLENNVALDGAGNASVFAIALETGPIEAAAGTVTNVDTPVTGWDAVTNTGSAIKGSDDESDPQLRARRERSPGRFGKSTIDATRSEVGNLDGVTKVEVLENFTDFPDANGLPPHSYQVVAVGGDDTEIAESINRKRDIGITPFGNTAVPIADSQGVPVNIAFSRPTEIDIYVSVTLNKFSGYPNNGDDLIKQAIVDYANGILIANRDFGLGDDVIYTRLYTPINTVPGHEISDLRIGFSPVPTGTGNLFVASTEISNFVIDNVTVA